MSRTNPFENNEEAELCGLAVDYIQNKACVDKYTKLADQENKEIKEALTRLGQDSISTLLGTVKKIVTHKYSMNEAKLIETIKRHNIEGLIKTKEYVDMEALENFIYHAPEGSESFLTDVSLCKTDTEVVQLRISKKKGE